MSIETHVFSSERRKLIEDFGNGTLKGDVGTIRRLWTKYSSDLQDARGIFVVNSPAFPRLPIPGDKDFGSAGFLRCWMAGDRLILVREGSDDFRFSSPIFCDTNFVSLCGAFQAGRDLGSLAAAFKDAVKFLLPNAGMLNAYPYLLETARNQDREKVRASLFGFACLKLTSAPLFSDTGRFVTQADGVSADEVADEAMRVTAGADFALLSGWAANRFLWAKVILTKAALIAFAMPSASAGARLYELLQFLHDRLARLPQFEIYAAFRFFELSPREPFFDPVQRNSRKLQSSLRAMAWDIAHWRTVLEILTVESWRSAGFPFPIPHFLSFDQRYVQLLESFQFYGLIYDVAHRRPEFFFRRSLLEPVSALLQTSCARFYSTELAAERSSRAKLEHDLEKKLEIVSTELELELNELLPDR